MHREPRVPEAEAQVGKWRLPCKDYLKGTCTTPLREKWHPPECLFYKTENGCKSKKNNDKSAIVMLKNARQIGLYGAAEVFIDFAEELRHTETDPMCSPKPCYVTPTFETKNRLLE